MRINKGLVILIIIGMFVNLGLIAYVLDQSVVGRQSVINTQRKACGFVKQDRRSIAILNRSITDGFADTDRRNPEPLTPERVQAETDLIADLPGILVRANLNCKILFPDASFKP